MHDNIDIEGQARVRARSIVNPVTGCWRWVGAGRGIGYGAVKVGGRVVDAHRYAWAVFNGPVPDGMQVLHRCDNRACVNPDHLELGNAKKNRDDAIARGAARGRRVDRGPQYGRLLRAARCRPPPQPGRSGARLPAVSHPVAGQGYREGNSMIMQHVVRLDRPGRPLHLPGEIVWVSLGNYRENPAATGKMRPVVILHATDCQHRVAGLTTQANYATTGEARVAVPIGPSCGLDDRPTYIWDRRPSWLCRLDVQTHAGWADEALIDTLAGNMDVPWHVIERMRKTVAAHAD